MARIVLSSPATLTGSEEKKTGPSRFNEDFLVGWVDTNFTDWHEFRSWKLGARIFDLMNALRTIPTGLYPTAHGPHPLSNINSQPSTAPWLAVRCNPFETNRNFRRKRRDIDFCITFLLLFH